MKKKFNLVFSSIALIAFMWFTITVLKLNLLPPKYLIVLLLVLALIVCFMFYKSFKSESKLLGFLSILITLVFIVIVPRISELDNLISKVTGNYKERHNVYTIVLKDSKDGTIWELK